MKARLRSLRLDRSRKRMLSAVPRATMVVANPTHYAVAMRYVRAEGGAPIVLAKGVDLDRAEDPRNRRTERSPDRRRQAAGAARSMTPWRSTAAIPPEFYRAVAEIVHLIQEKKSSWPLTQESSDVNARIDRSRRSAPRP